MKKIYYNMPDFVAGKRAYMQVLSWVREAPYIFHEDSEIISIFGCPPHCIWNGGGCDVFENYYLNAQAIKELIESYNYRFGIPIRFTFTNLCLEEKYYYDAYGNMLAEIGHNGMNEIVISDPKFEEYLRANYPNYKYVKSVIGTKDKPVFLDDKYYLSVMRRRMNNNWNYLETIPEDKRSKVEFLCTDPCPDNCPRIYTHYKNFARSQVSHGLNEHNMDCNMNRIKGEFNRNYSHSLETFISREKILQEYLPRGFNVFKISGRYSPGAIITGIADYLIKPEYKTDVIEILISLYTYEGGLKQWF